VIVTDLTVCNLAIDRVSGDRIDALDEESPLGQFCADNYPHKREFILGKYRWTFATQVAPLARMDPEPLEPRPCAYKFAPPSDLIGAVHDWRDTVDPNDKTRSIYVLEANDHYWSDDATVFIEYTANRPESRWPASFRQLVITAFAADLADHCQRPRLADKLFVEAWGTPQEGGEGGLYKTARNEDSRMAPQRRLVSGIDPGPLVEARTGYLRPGSLGFRLASEA
jgi:hypothetical protein